MNITKRITKFLLIAALAIPAWTTASAQNRTVPPEMAPTENQVREKAKDLKGLSVATRNSESRSVGKSVSINASNAIKLSTPISKVKVSTAPDGPKVKGVKPVNAVNSDAKTCQPRRTSAPQLKAPDLRTDVPDGYALIVFVANDVWGDGSGYQMLIDQNATMYASWNSNGISQSIYNMAEYTIPENADYNASGNATNFLVNQTGQVVVPAGIYDIIITNPTPGDKVYAASANGNIGGRIDDYAIAAGNVYTFTVSLGGTNDQTDVAITSVADALGDPTNLVADPSYTSADISWEAGMNNEGWNLRYRPYVDVKDYNRLWDFPVADETTVSTGGWMLYDYDGDGNNWAYAATDSNPITDACLYSQSWISGTGAVTPDNWAISPEVKLGGTLKFKARTNGYTEKLGVFVYQGDLNGISASNLVQVGSDLTLTSSNTTFAEYEYNLGAFDGYGYIIIRHYNCTDGYNLLVDDIQIIVPDNQELPQEAEWTYVNDVTNPYTITDLTNNTTYEVQVQGVGNNTTTDWTNSVVFTTLESIDPTTELDFGSVDVESSKTLSAYIANDSDNPVTAAVTVAPNPPFSVANTTVTLAANTLTSIPVTFTPSEARSYTGTLTVVAGDVTTTIPLKGVGNMSGPEAVRDSAFYAGISYKWPINVTNPTDTSRLDEVATDPDQMIALIREVYTNKSIPGNFKRGYANTGGTSYFGTHDNNVQYTGAGLIERDGSYVSFSDAYGWDIPSDSLIIGSSNSISYAYMNPYQYKPDNEGVTLLLLEMVDDFDPNNVTVSATGYAGLKELFSKTLKSVRVITQAKRTGEGESRGTLFNIDCDKMNKFYLLAKGQLGWLRSAWFNHQSSTFTSFYTEPCYIYSSSYDEYADPALEKFFFLGHMFEQFSPASPNATATELDLYRKMTTGDSFPVVHDCPNVPYIESGHHFMMYGTESGAADCQDVRDLMFFVPDYRMMDHADRGSKSSSSSLIFQDYFEYHPNHQPTMGLYVIIQDSVEAVTRADSYFKLKLTWDSNMDEFLPGEQQEYQLYEVITDEFGVSKWVPVYKRNEQGQYWNPTTNAWQADTTGAERVVLTLDPSNTKKTYAEVYEMRENSGRIVTYAVRGQDVEHFLSLQMSNEESYFIPGKDPAEMALMSSATVYSRYEAQNENNCYSNKIQIKSSPRTIKSSYLTDGNTMTINRIYAKLENGETVTVTEPIATLTINTSGKYFTVTGSVVENQASVKSLFPVGTHDGKTAGYHANNLTNNRISYTTSSYNNTTYINFDINLWDNFVANVSKNDHPGMYTYQLRFNTATPFQGLNGSTSEAYSNPYRVYVYKTDSQINEPLTLEQVNGDTGCSDAYKPGDVEFSAQVMLSSKSEILRYDAYRWNEGAERSIVDYGGETDEDEEDYDPNGIAGNQGDSYSVTMNAIGTDDYYVGNAVPVTAEAPQNWAKFVDYYPAKLVNGGAFTYAPVVELFTRGYVEGTTKERGDYNTYGGPLKTTAVGKIELEIPDNLNTAGNPFMSTYKWLDGEDWCAYYKIPVKFKVLGIPEGYELYKIRAWRDVDTNILREELSSRQDRIASNYLFEELTYGDALGDGHTMSKENLYKNVDGTVYSYELGRRAVENYDADSNIQGETHATFGALRINTKDNQPYAIDNLEATIKVRAYFTKTSNPIISESGSKASSRDLTAAEYPYYVAEGEVEFNSNMFNQIITGVTDVTMNGTREVVSVSYVNTIGQVSSTPWKGVNMVVTRYTDGSTSTTKVMK